MVHGPDGLTSSAMTSTFDQRSISLILFVCLFSVYCTAQTNCNTQANPSCAGDSRFSHICCPSPSTCYFKDRLGTPSCCGAGQVCLIAQSVPVPVILNSANSLATSLGQVRASMSKFAMNNFSLTTPAAAFSTVETVFIEAAQLIVHAKEGTPILLTFMLMASAIC